MSCQVPPDGDMRKTMFTQCPACPVCLGLLQLTPVCLFTLFLLPLPIGLGSQERVKKRRKEKLAEHYEREKQDRES